MSYKHFGLDYLAAIKTGLMNQEYLMSKYDNALDRSSIDLEEVGQRKSLHPSVVAKTQGLARRPREIASRSETSSGGSPLLEVSVPEHSTGVPVPQELPGELSEQRAIRQLCERIAPRAAVERSCRVAISGCRSNDGASSIAAAFALDLSQRLSVRTLLVDANLRAPSLHRVLSAGNRRNTEVTLDGSLQFRATGYPRLTLATMCVEGEDLERDLVLEELEKALRSFPAVVIDLGVVRLDPWMLPVVRPLDPIMLVVRYGQTQRHELATTTAALRATDRTVAGVILNAIPSRFYTSSGEHSIYE